MLCLTRKPAERVRVTLPDGLKIQIRVNRVRGSRVTLGFEAPEEVRIVRDELAPKPPNHEAPENDATPDL
jgi:carbon storage regulator CsrA